MQDKHLRNEDEDEGKHSNLKINLNGLHKALKQMEDSFPFLPMGVERRGGGGGGGGGGCG
jgi:hypothetical protein